FGEKYRSLSAFPSHSFQSGGGTLDRNIWPDFRVFRVQCQPFLKPWFGISLDGIDGTFRFANATVDAFVRMDHEHILALVEAVHGAHRDANHGFAANAAFVDHQSQFSTPNALEAPNLSKKSRTVHSTQSEPVLLLLRSVMSAALMRHAVMRR